MNPNSQTPSELLNRAVDRMRQSGPASEQVEQAAARVLRNLQVEHGKVVPHPSAAAATAAVFDDAGKDRIAGCEDFRSLIPAHVAGKQTAARRILFEDHVRECAGCRRALETARQGGSGKTTFEGRRAGSGYLRWAVPVAALVLAAIALQTAAVRDFIWPIQVHAVVQAVNGGLFDITGQDSRSLAAGERIDRGQIVRTGNESGAVLEMADGSEIELAPRSELYLDRARDGVSIKLRRGNVIVTAARQRQGHLYVDTGDCSVSVVGTVFSVSAGVKGSRVAVIEGEVHVQQGSVLQVLQPGQQTFTNPEMSSVPLEHEVAWSRNAEALLKEIAAFGDDFSKRAENAAMRFTSNLVPLVPEDTLVFASFPNATQSFAQSYALFRQRITENPSLAAWWRQNEGSAGRLSLDEIMARISEVGGHLGGEVVLAVAKNLDDRPPLLLAETSAPDQLAYALEGDIDRLRQIGGEDPDLVVARSPEQLAAVPAGKLVLYVRNGLLAVSDAARLRQIDAVRDGRTVSGFPGTPLYYRLEQAYRDGAGWLFAVDVRQLVPGGVPGNGALEQMGFGDVQQLVVEQRTGSGAAASRATLGFSQQRRGIAAWIAAPAPMGALEFVSPDAYAFNGGIVKDPALMLDDILQLAGGPVSDLQEIEQELRIDLRRDLAEPLGNEFLMAIDGPVLPTPSWKLVIEVNDAPRLENTIQWLVTSLNRQAELKQAPLRTLSSETIEGRTYYVLRTKDSPSEIHYTFWLGYLIVAPQRALLMDAIRNHDAGNTIARSPEFRALLPPDGRDYASVILYQHVEALSKSLPDGTVDLFTGQLPAPLRGLSSLPSALPRVVFVHGESDRIMMSAKGAFGLNMAGMLGLHGLLGAAGLHPGAR